MAKGRSDGLLVVDVLCLKRRCGGEGEVCYEMLQLNRWCPETADATVPRPLLALGRIPGKISLQREKNFSMRIKFYLCRFRGWGLVGRGDSAGGAD